MEEIFNLNSVGASINIIKTGDDLHSHININDLWDKHPDEKSKVMMFGKLVEIPRFQKVYGRNYNFAGVKNEGEEIPKWLEPYFLDVCKREGISPYRTNLGAVVNWYEDGKSHIGFHSDSEEGLMKGKGIYCYSRGATRDFLVKRKKGNYTMTFPLEDKTLLIMNNCQKDFQHSIPKRLKCKEKRISITIRIFEEKDDEFSLWCKEQKRLHKEGKLNDDDYKNIEELEMWINHPILW